MQGLLPSSLLQLAFVINLTNHVFPQSPQSSVTSVARMGGGNCNQDAQRAHESREQLRLKYREHVLEADPDQRAKNREQLKEDVKHFVCSVPVFILRLCHVLLEVFNMNKEEADWHPRRGSEALRVIEQFALNLWDHPWKKELRNIKQYTGFYQGNIGRKLKGSELYFRLMGYEVLPGQLLKLSQLNKDVVETAAFEIYLSTAYFSYLGRAFDIVEDRGYTVLQVWTARETWSGEPQEVAERMLAELEPAHRLGVDPMDIEVTVNQAAKQADHTTTTTDQTENLPNGAGATRPKTQTKQNVRVHPNIVALDADSAPKRRIGSDSGYVSKPNSQEIQEEELEKLRHPPKRDAAKRKMAGEQGNYVNVEHLSKQLGNLTQRHSEHCEPATIDEHVGMSLKAVEGTKNNREKMVEDDEMSDWSFVNDELNKRQSTNGLASLNHKRPDVTRPNITDHNGVMEGPHGLRLHDVPSEDMPQGANGMNLPDLAHSNHYSRGFNGYENGERNNRYTQIHTRTGPGLTQSAHPPPAATRRKLSNRGGDLWVTDSITDDNRKLLLTPDEEDNNSQLGKYLLQDVKAPPSDSKLGFSTFGKEGTSTSSFVSKTHPVRGSRGLARDSGHSYSFDEPSSTLERLSTRYDPYDHIGGEIQSDSANLGECDDKVGQLLWNTERVLDETLRKPPRSGSYGNHTDFYSLPSTTGGAAVTDHVGRGSVTDAVVPSGTASKQSRDRPLGAARGASPASSSSTAATTTPQGLLSPLAAPWQCSSCTFINTEMKMICQICGKSRRLLDSSPQCPQCTLVNDTGAISCQACGHLFKGQTYL